MIFVVFFAACSENEFSTEQAVFLSSHEDLSSHVGKGLKLSFEFDRDIHLANNAPHALSLHTEVLDPSHKSHFDTYSYKILGNKIEIQIDEFHSSGTVEIKFNKDFQLKDKWNISVPLDKVSASIHVQSYYVQSFCDMNQARSFLHDNGQLYLFCLSKKLQQYVFFQYNVANLHFDLLRVLDQVDPNQTSVTINSNTPKLLNKHHLIAATASPTNNRSVRSSALYHFPSQKIITLPHELHYDLHHVEIGDHLFFSAEGGLIKFNKTSLEVDDYIPLPNASQFSVGSMAYHSGRIFFSGNDGVDPNNQLWTYNPITGTSAEFLKQASTDGTDPKDFFIYNDELYFTARYLSSRKRTLDKYDSQTHTSSSINFDSNPYGGFQSNPIALLGIYDSKLYFRSVVGTYRSGDGSPLNVSTLVYDFTTEEASEIVSREVLLGGGPYTKDFFSTGAMFQNNFSQNRMTWVGAIYRENTTIYTGDLTLFVYDTLDETHQMYTAENFAQYGADQLAYLSQNYGVLNVGQEYVGIQNNTYGLGAIPLDLNNL